MEKQEVVRRNTVSFVNHADDINEIREMIAAHPDFKDLIENAKKTGGGGRNKSMYTSAAAGGDGNFKGMQGAENADRDGLDEIEMQPKVNDPSKSYNAKTGKEIPDLMPSSN